MFAPRLALFGVATGAAAAAAVGLAATPAAGTVVGASGAAVGAEAAGAPQASISNCRLTLPPRTPAPANRANVRRFIALPPDVLSTRSCPSVTGHDLSLPG